MAKLDGCSLKRMEDLSFTFEGGSCNSFKKTNDSDKKDVIYLCFGDTENRQCRT